MRHVTGGEGTCEGESRETLRDGCGLCEGRGGRRSVWSCGSRAFLSLLAGPRSPPYASSSKPMPTLCPPALKFFPSIRAERVTFTPAGTPNSQRVSQTVTRVNQLMDKPAAYTSQLLSKESGSYGER